MSPGRLEDSVALGGVRGNIDVGGADYDEREKGDEGVGERIIIITIELAFLISEVQVSVSIRLRDCFTIVLEEESHIIVLKPKENTLDSTSTCRQAVIGRGTLSQVLDQISGYSTSLDVLIVTGFNVLLQWSKKNCSDSPGGMVKDSMLQL